MLLKILNYIFILYIYFLAIIIHLTYKIYDFIYRCIRRGKINKIK